MLTVHAYKGACVKWYTRQREMAMVLKDNGHPYYTKYSSIHHHYKSNDMHVRVCVCVCVCVTHTNNALTMH